MTESGLLESAASHGIGLLGLSEYYWTDKESAPESRIVIGYSGMDGEAIREAASLLGEIWSL